MIIRFRSVTSIKTLVGNFFPTYRLKNIGWNFITGEFFRTSNKNTKNLFWKKLNLNRISAPLIVIINHKDFSFFIRNTY